MPEKGFTNKACPGCGELGRRKQNEVCHDCKKILKWAKQQAKELNKTHKSFLFPEQPHWLPYLPHLSYEKKTDLRRSFHKLVLEAKQNAWTKVESDRTDWRPDSHLEHDVSEPLIVLGQDRGDNPRRIVVLESGEAKALQDLYIEINASLKDAYVEGLDEGTNMLRQLATDRITNEEFNEMCIRKREL